MEKKRLGVVITLVILSILMLFIIINLVGINKKIMDKNSNINENIDVNDNNVNNEEEPKVINMDINSMFVQNLYKYIVGYNPETEETVYKNKKVTHNDIGNTLKIITVFNNINLENDKDDYRRVKFDDDSSNDYYDEYIFEKSTIERKAKEIFGNDVIINSPDKKIVTGNEINYENNKYVVSPFGRQAPDGFISRTSLVKAERVGNEVYLYDKYVHTNWENYPDCYKERYNASDKKVLLPELSIEEIDEYINNRESNLIFKDTNTFKHTFKVNNEGLYNWISTEIVK